MTWRSASRDAVLDVASQPDVDHRILIVGGPPNRVAVGADALLRIHTRMGVVGSFASRELRFENGALQLQAEGKPSLQLQPRDILWAELQTSDDGIGWPWISMSQQSVVDIATQPNIAHRVLETPTDPEKITINGETPVRIHTVGGIKRPVPSRYLHSNGDDLEVESPWGPPAQVDPLGADFRVPDHKATLTLVLGITIPVALFLAAGFIVAASWKGFGGQGLLCVPGTACSF